MTPKLKNFLSVFIPLIIGLVLVYYQYQSLTDEELSQIFLHFSQANYFYIFLSISCLLLAHFIRAYRWQYALKFMGFETTTTNNFLAVLISYFMNLTIPRSGEVSRAAYLYKYQKVNFDKAFGTIITERILDFLVFLLFVILGLTFNFKIIYNAFFEDINLIQIVVLILGILIGIVVFIKIWHHPGLKFIQIIKSKLMGFVEGMNSIIKMKEKKTYVLQAFVIWILYFLMFYMFFLALDDAKIIDLNVVLMGFIFGSLAIGLTNGGIGAYPLAVAIVLGLFGVSKEIGVSVGWLAWTTQTIVTVIFGILALLIAPLHNKKK